MLQISYKDVENLAHGLNETKDKTPDYISTAVININRINSQRNLDFSKQNKFFFSCLLLKMILTNKKNQNKINSQFVIGGIDGNEE